MHWVGFGLQMLIPLAIAVYTVNFGRWMWNKQHRPGAIGAYVISALSFVAAFVSLLHDSLL